MNLTHPHSIEDYIVTFLQNSSIPIVELIARIQEKRPGTTKQAVYLIIRKLKKEEIVVVHKKNISLSGVWVTAMENFFASAKYSSTKETSDSNSFLTLDENKKLTYTFKNAIVHDAFWSHVFITLVEVSSPAQPVLIYNPHEWFLLARYQNEMDLFNKIKARGQKLAVLVGDNTPLDKTSRKHFDNEKLMIEFLEQPLFDKNNYYINVIGDFVIEVWLDKVVALQLDAFYTKGEENIEELNKILDQKGKNKFSITRNKRKADILRKKFKKYFFL